MGEAQAPGSERPRRSLMARTWRRAWRVWRRVWFPLGMAVALSPPLLCAALAMGGPFPPSPRPGDYFGHLSFQLTLARLKPDSMTYIETDDAGNITFSATVTNPDLVSRWFSYVNDETPIDTWLGCSGFAVEPPPVYRTYTFSARGVPIEKATAITGDTSCQYEYRLSAGSADDPFLYFLSDPHDSPSPPPVGHQEVP